MRTGEGFAEAQGADDSLVLVSDRGCDDDQSVGARRGFASEGSLDGWFRDLRSGSEQEGAVEAVNGEWWWGVGFAGDVGEFVCVERDRDFGQRFGGGGLKLDDFGVEELPLSDDCERDAEREKDEGCDSDDGAGDPAPHGSTRRYPTPRTVTISMLFPSFRRSATMCMSTVLVELSQ